MCLVIFCFITGETRGVSWYRDSSYWTVNIRSSTVEEYKDVMSTLRKEHTENKWNIWLELLSPKSTKVIFNNLSKCTYI